MTAEQLRKTAGGVVGCFTPKEIEVDYTALASTGDKSIGLKVPAGKLIIGGYIKNKADDLASSGSATLRLKAVDYDGSSDQAFGSAAAAKADIKGKGVYQPILTDLGTAPEADNVPTAICTTVETDIQVTVGTAGLTAGKLIVGVLYI